MLSGTISITKQRQINLRNIMPAFFVILLVGSVYITQLIFQEISKSFNIDILNARFVFSLSCFFYAISFFIFGPLSDKLSARGLVTFGCIGTIFCLVISVMIHSFNVYLAIMSLTGFFAASVPAALFAYTAKNTPNEKLPEAMGMMISASIIGIIFSRSIVAMLTDLWSWQFSFSIYAFLIFCASITIPFVIKRETNSSAGISIGSTFINAGKLLLNKTVLIFLLVGFLLFFIYLGISSILTFYLKDAPYYLTSTVLGWLNFAGISAIIGATITGKLSQFVTEKNLLLFCLLCVTASVITIGYSTNLFFIALGIFCLFLFVFAIQPIIISMLNKIVPHNSRGTMSSLYLLSCLAGGSIGTHLLGILYENIHWHGLIITCIFLALINILFAFVGLKIIKNSRLV